MNSNFSAAFTHRQQPLASSAESFFVLGEVEPNQMIDSSVLVRQLGRPPDHRFGKSGKTNGSGGHIEKAFRISKTDLRIRPIYHRLEHRIQAHLIIAFCSYKLYKELERQLHEKKLNLSAERAVQIMQSIFTVTTKLPVSRKSIRLIMAKTFEQQQLLGAFEVKF